MELKVDFNLEDEDKPSGPQQLILITLWNEGFCYSPVLRRDFNNFDSIFSKFFLITHCCV